MSLFNKETPSVMSIRRYASEGLSKEMIAAKYDMYEAEFEDVLKQNEDFQRAYDLGVVEARGFIQKQLLHNKRVVSVLFGDQKRSQA